MRMFRNLSLVKLSFLNLFFFSVISFGEYFILPIKKTSYSFLCCVYCHRCNATNSKKQNKKSILSWAIEIDKYYLNV